jgi:hypothetical protein
MRRSTSAISESDAPDFNTMIISGLPALSPLRWFDAKKGRGLVARGLGVGHRRGRSVRPRLPDR